VEARASQLKAFHGPPSAALAFEPFDWMKSRLLPASGEEQTHWAWGIVEGHEIIRWHPPGGGEHVFLAHRPPLFAGLEVDFTDAPSRNRARALAFLGDWDMWSELDALRHDHLRLRVDDTKLEAACAPGRPVDLAPLLRVSGHLRLATEGVRSRALAQLREHYTRLATESGLAVDEDLHVTGSRDGYQLSLRPRTTRDGIFAEATARFARPSDRGLFVGLRHDPRLAEVRGVSTGDLVFDRAFVVALSSPGSERSLGRQRLPRETRALLMELAPSLACVAIDDHGVMMRTAVPLSGYAELAAFLDAPLRTARTVAPHGSPPLGPYR
jgi:hypothetical protein